jgi:nucleoside-diphosphate-sugar epimerase
VARGASVRGLVREASDTSHLDDLPVLWLRGNVYDPDLVKEAVDGVDAIFHLATPYRRAQASADEMHNVHVVSTKLLAHEAIKMKPMPRFIHVSTVGVHGHIEKPPADESYPMRPRDDYQETKAEAELWITEFARREGLPVTVVRPTAIFGPGDRRLFKIFWMVAHRIVPVIGNGKHLYHLVHVEDLTDFLVFVSENPKAIGETYICGSERAISYQHFLHTVASQYGLRFSMVRLPATPLLALADFCERIFPKLKLSPPLYRRRLHFFLFDRSFNTRKMRSIGFVPRRNIDTALRETAQWYVDQGWLRLGSVLVYLTI